MPASRFSPNTWRAAVLDGPRPKAAPTPIPRRPIRTGILSIIAAAGLAASANAQPVQAGSQLAVRTITSTFPTAIASFGGQLGLKEQPADAAAPYIFVRVAADGTTTKIETPAGARPLFGSGGELAGYRVIDGPDQTLHAWDANGRDRWSLSLPSKVQAHVLPTAGYFTIIGGVEGCMDSAAKLQFYGPAGNQVGSYEAEGMVCWSVSSGPTGLVAFFQGDANGKSDNEIVLLSATGDVLARRALVGSAGRFGFAGLSVGANGAAGVAMVRENGQSQSSTVLVTLLSNGAVQSTTLPDQVGKYPAFADATHVVLLGSRTTRVWNASNGSWDGPMLKLPGFALARQAQMLGRNLLLLTSDEGKVSLVGRSLDSGASVLERQLPDLEPETGRGLFAAQADGVVVTAGSQRILIAKESN